MTLDDDRTIGRIASRLQRSMRRRRRPMAPFLTTTRSSLAVVAMLLYSGTIDALVTPPTMSTFAKSTNQAVVPLCSTLPASAAADTDRQQTTARESSKSSRRSYSNNDSASSFLSADSISFWSLPDNPFLQNSQVLSVASSFAESDALSSSVSSLIPILSAALLLASNTIGASCLALPEVCRGPGLGPSMMIFVAAYGANWLSGLAIAKVAIHAQQEQQQQNAGSSAASSSISSFQDLAARELGPHAATAVSILSMLVNTCALMFDASRMGPIAQSAIQAIGLNVSDQMTLSSSELMLIWTGLLAMLVATQSNQRLSVLASINVAVLMVSFGSVLVPALQHLQDPLAALAQPGTAALVQDPMALTSSMSQAAPVILMAMVYQNIVPSIVKLLKYDWNKTVAAITLGSAIPLGLYMAWCLANSNSNNGTMEMGDSAITGLVFTVFSVVTVMGSSMGSIMSLSEEIQPFMASTEQQVSRRQRKHQWDENQADDRYPLPSVMLSICMPLAINLCLGDDADFTPALATAGSIGSPLLYGAIPAMMLYAQQQRQKHTASSFLPNNETSYFKVATDLPRFRDGLPLLGILSAVIIGKELIL